MNLISEALLYLNDPLNWTLPGGILDRLEEHLHISGLAVLLGCLVAWPLGAWLGHTGRGGGFVVMIANLTRAVPTLALLTLLAASFAGFGPEPVIIALAVFAVPPLLANAYLGLREVDPEARDAARGMGLSNWQLLYRVELPLAAPYFASGFRTAAVQVVATATLAVFVAGGGLGTIIAEGIGLGLDSHAGQVFGGALLVAALALLVEGVFAGVERMITPKALRQMRAQAKKQASSRGKRRPGGGAGTEDRKPPSAAADPTVGVSGVS